MHVPRFFWPVRHQCQGHSERRYLHERAKLGWSDLRRNERLAIQLRRRHGPSPGDQQLTFKNIPRGRHRHVRILWKTENVPLVPCECPPCRSYDKLVTGGYPPEPRKRPQLTPACIVHLATPNISRSRETEGKTGAQGLAVMLRGFAPLQANDSARKRQEADCAPRSLP